MEKKKLYETLELDELGSALLETGMEPGQTL